MPNTVSIQINHTSVGSIDFNEAPEKLEAQRTILGFNLMIPARIRLRQSDPKARRPMLSNVRGDIYAADTSGSLIQIGKLRYDWPVTGAFPEHSQNADFIWSDCHAALVAYDKIRDGKPARLQISVSGEICHLVRFDGLEYAVPTESHRVTGTVHVTYSRDIWVQMIRSLGLAEHILVEVPVPSSPPAPWDEIWQALVEARDAFERGGTTGWKGCVNAVRLALEKWGDIEEPDMGPGWKAPTIQDREGRPKKQRFDNLRWHLLQCAHLGPHSGADNWTRDDALLMLTTLSALVAERNP